MPVASQNYAKTMSSATSSFSYTSRLDQLRPLERKLTVHQRAGMEMATSSNSL